MADEQEMSWGEAEAHGRNMVNWLRAVEKFHDVCVKVRQAGETLDRLKVEADGYAQKIADADKRIVNASAKADQAEAESNKRIASANDRMSKAEKRATEEVATAHAQFQQMKDALIAAQKDHQKALADMEKQAAAYKRSLEMEHSALVAKYREDEAKAKAARDEAVATLRSYIKSVPV